MYVWVGAKERKRDNLKLLDEIPPPKMLELTFKIKGDKISPLKNLKSPLNTTLGS